MQERKVALEVLHRGLQHPGLLTRTPLLPLVLSLTAKQHGFGQALADARGLAVSELRSCCTTATASTTIDSGCSGGVNGGELAQPLAGSGHVYQLCLALVSVEVDWREIVKLLQTGGCLVANCHVLHCRHVVRML